MVNNLWDSKENGLLLGAFESGAATSINGKRLTTKDRLVGVMAARAGPQLFSDQMGAVVEHWFVHQEYRTTTAAVKLLVGLRMWAKKNNCTTLMVPTNSGTKLKQTDKLLRKLGYAMVGGTYASSIS